MTSQDLDETKTIKPFVRYGVSSKRGIRSENQDSHFAKVELLMASFAVADGAGGHQFGGHASRLTVDALRSELESNCKYTSEYISLLMKKKYEQINRFIFEEASQKGVVTATTLSLLNIFRNKLIVSNVGDTKVFQIRDDQLVCISDIQTAAWEAFKQGKISREEIEDSPYKHVLTGALGAGATVLPYMNILDPQSLDIYLICSDGVYNFVEEARLKQLFDQQKLLENEELTILCEQCVNEALNNKGNDNATILAVQIV